MNDATFQERYKKLNPEQKQAVDTIDGPVLVVAGPGTGKTEILTLRIANILLKTDTPASGILALTFTDSGVRAMRKKLREVIGSRESEVRVHTFHSFAGSVISEFDEHFPHIARAKQLSEVESQVLLREILTEPEFAKLRPLGEPDLYIWKILKTISEAKKEAWTPEIVADFAQKEIVRIQNSEESLSSRGPTKGQLKADALKRIERCEKTVLLADVYKIYEEKKRALRKIDFDDLLFEFLRTLKTDELLLRLLQEKFLYILVDEHQDTNDAQNEIVQLLANFFDTPNVFVVGDEKQAIYRFQGASVENFLRFQNIWKDMKIISLSDNYRSHQALLDASFAMIEGNYADGEHTHLRVRLTAKSGHVEKPVELVTAGNTEAIDAYLTKELKRITTDEPSATVALIVRENADVSHVLDLCERHSIPASAERGANIFAHPVGALYFTLLEYLLDPSKVEAFCKVISAGLFGFDFVSGAEIIKKIRSGNLFVLHTAIPALVELQKESLVSSPMQYVILVAERSGLLEHIAHSPLSAEVWRGVVDLARDLAENGGIEDARTLISALVEYKISAETKNIKVSSGISEAFVTITTAHSSKGLEYDYVFVPYANEGTWLKKHKGALFVLPREKAEGDEIRDARRLFYVALTRARKHATVLSALADAQGRELVPLRFVDELDSAYVSKVSIQSVRETERGVSTKHLQETRKTEIIEYAKTLLLEKGLSVTALNHFCDCPSQFLYKSILKLPEAPSASSEKGNAMHKALDDVWHSDEKTTNKIADVMTRSVTQYFDTSLLPKFEKSAILTELSGDIPNVAPALTELFNTSGVVSSEKWAETVFETAHAKKHISLNLHGKLDAVIEQEKKVLVFDYKTKLAMSVNAIKGETKSDDGNYFRQLVFYKILLAGNSQYSEKEIHHALIFVRPDEKGRCPTVEVPIVDADVEKVKSEIDSLVTSVWSGDFLSATCDEADCKWCAFKKEFTSATKRQ